MWSSVFKYKFTFTQSELMSKKKKIHYANTDKNICSMADIFSVVLTVPVSGDNSERKEGNVLFNDVLNTFYLRLYGVRHMVTEHSDN